MKKHGLYTKSDDARQREDIQKLSPRCSRAKPGVQGDGDPSFACACIATMNLERLGQQGAADVVCVYRLAGNGDRGTDFGRRKVGWRKGIAISQRASAGPAFLRSGQ